MVSNKNMMTNIDHKLISVSMSICRICDRDCVDYSNLKHIESKERQNIGRLTENLGRRSLDLSHRFKYPEDEQIRWDSKYIDPIIGKSPLWTICNCEKVVHPECLLQSLSINFNYKCDVCDHVYRLGFKVINYPLSPKFYIGLSIKILIAVGLLTLFFIMISRNSINSQSISDNNKLIILFRGAGLALLCLFLVLSTNILANIFDLPRSANLYVYLLPFPHKYELNFGIERLEMMTNSGGTCRDLLSKITEQVDTAPKEDFNLEAVAGGWTNCYQARCPFYQEMMLDLKLMENLSYKDKNKIIQNRFIYDYSDDGKKVIKRFLEFLMVKFKFSNLDELVELRVDRKSFFGSQVQRNNMELKEYNEMRSLIQTKTIMQGFRHRNVKFASIVSSSKRNSIVNRSSAEDLVLHEIKPDELNIEKKDAKKVGAKFSKVRIQINKQSFANSVEGQYDLFQSPLQTNKVMSRQATLKNKKRPSTQLAIVKNATVNDSKLKTAITIIKRLENHQYEQAHREVNTQAPDLQKLTTLNNQSINKSKSADPISSPEETHDSLYEVNKMDSGEDTNKQKSKIMVHKDSSSINNLDYKSLEASSLEKPKIQHFRESQTSQLNNTSFKDDESIDSIYASNPNYTKANCNLLENEKTTVEIGTSHGKVDNKDELDETLTFDFQNEFFFKNLEGQKDLKQGIIFHKLSTEAINIETLQSDTPYFLTKEKLRAPFNQVANNNLRISS